jgi:hypothetical protein
MKNCYNISYCDDDSGGGGGDDHDHHHHHVFSQKACKIGK